MEKDLIHIDLIDKYLNQKLTTNEVKVLNKLLMEDSNFAKEIEIYRAIYEGIEHQGNAALKKRFEGYYQDYKNETASKNGRGKVITLIMRLSLAASLVLGGYLFYNNYSSSPRIINGNEPSVVVSDTIRNDQRNDSILEEGKKQLAEEEKTLEEIKKQDTVQRYPFYHDNIQLSIGGIKSFSPQQVRQIDYPAQMKYSFDGDTVTLYGNPLLPALQLQILKNTDGEYILKLRNNYFKLNKSSTRNILVKSSQDYNLGDVTEEQIGIKIENAASTSKPFTNMEVLVSDSSAPIPTYYFNKNDSQLILSGSLDYKNATVYLIDTGQEKNYFLKIENILYELSSHQESPTQLVRTDILKDKTSRLFRERDIFFKKIYKVK